MEERLQKILSQCGACSRRKAEEFLLAGRVTVDGKTASLGDKGDISTQTIALDGKVLTPPQKHTYILLNKPRGYITSLSDEKGRPTVIDLLSGLNKRVYPVGRLDYDSEGLLILTDDGALTQKLLHPSHRVEKEYHTWVLGDVKQAIPKLSNDLNLEGERVRGAKVKLLQFETQKASILSITIGEGKNRQVRRMCALCGLEVVRLKRVREGALKLENSLAVGTWRHLNEDEIKILQENLPKK